MQTPHGVLPPLHSPHAWKEKAFSRKSSVFGTFTAYQNKRNTAGLTETYSVPGTCGRKRDDNHHRWTFYKPRRIYVKCASIAIVCLSIYLSVCLSVWLSCWQLISSMYFDLTLISFDAMEASPFAEGIPQSISHMSKSSVSGLSLGVNPYMENKVFFFFCQQCIMRFSAYSPQFLVLNHSIWYTLIGKEVHSNFLVSVSVHSSY